MRRYFWPVVSLFVAAGIQGNLPASVSILGGKPDLILVVLIAYSLSGDPGFGAMLGFFAGLVHGTAVGMSLGSFIVTRTLTGFLAGLTTTRVFGENPLVPTLSAAWLTLVCEGIFVLANPTASFTAALRTILGEAISNALLTLIVSWVLRGFETRRKIKLANARL